jgi:hypothetical protein
MVCRIGCHPNVRRKIGVLAYLAFFLAIPLLTADRFVIQTSLQLEAYGANRGRG